jgi:hypothetical protein
MKKLKVLLGLLLGISYMALGQDIQFLNYSICNLSSMNTLDETNAYVQGGGHNVYLSYSLEQQAGSFSETKFAYGTEENPKIILLDTVNGTIEKKYFKRPINDLYAGTRGDDMWVSEGLWGDYTAPNDPMLADDASYEKKAFRCAAKDRSENKSLEDIEEDTSTNFDRRLNN